MESAGVSWKFFRVLSCRQAQWPACSCACLGLRGNATISRFCTMGNVERTEAKVLQVPLLSCLRVSVHGISWCVMGIFQGAFLQTGPVAHPARVI